MGRLIDADKAIESMQYYHDDCAKTSEYTRLGFETAIEVVKDSPTIEAIPKADYEARLKSDMVAMLEELKKEIGELKSYESADGQDLAMLADIGILFSQKINSLKGEDEKC